MKYSLLDHYFDVLELEIHDIDDLGDKLYSAVRDGVDADTPLFVSLRRELESYDE